MDEPTSSSQSSIPSPPMPSAPMAESTGPQMPVPAARMSWGSAIATSIIGWLISFVLWIVLVLVVVIGGLNSISNTAFVNELQDAKINWEGAFDDFISYAEENPGGSVPEDQWWINILEDNAKGTPPEITDDKLGDLGASVLKWVAAGVVGWLLISFIVWPVLIRLASGWVSTFRVGIGGALLSVLAFLGAAFVGSFVDGLLIVTFGLVSVLAGLAANSAVIRLMAKPKPR
jgi:hypothetical protein